LPEQLLVERLKAAGCKILSSATTVNEARCLEDHGVDAVIAQGAGAGGHRGMFLTSDFSSQLGTLSLAPQVVDAVKYRSSRRAELATAELLRPRSPCEPLACR
jgi:nitronate monooxygenase